MLADWRDHAATTRSATLDVVAGKSYAVRLEYYDNASTASVSLRYLFENVTDLERRIAAADAVIYCAGFDSDTERENHDRTFALPEGQAAEIAAVAKLNANLVVVVNSGGGVDFAQFADRARAILMAWYPGQEGGRAVAEILTGAVSPSGKLPISIERRAEDNPCYGSYYENVDRSHRKGAPQISRRGSSLSAAGRATKRPPESGNRPARPRSRGAPYRRRRRRRAAGGSPRASSRPVSGRPSHSL